MDTPSCGQIILKLSFLGLVFKQCPLTLYIVPRSRPNNEVGSKGLGLWIAYIRMASRLAAAVVAVLSLLPKLRESLLLREVHKGPLLGSLGKFLFKWLVLAFSFCKQTPFKHAKELRRRSAYFKKFSAAFGSISRGQATTQGKASKSKLKSQNPSSGCAAFFVNQTAEVRLAIRKHATSSPDLRGGQKLPQKLLQADTGSMSSCTLDQTCTGVSCRHGVCLRIGAK